MIIEKKAPAGKFRVIAIEWPNMDTLILVGDFDALKDAEKKAAACSALTNVVSSVFDDKGKTV